MSELNCAITAAIVPVQTNADVARVGPWQIQVTNVAAR